MAFTIRRGTNISHWLSQSTRRGEARRDFFTQEDVRYLAGLGFDHLRLPVDEEQLWREDGAPDAEAFGLLDAALDWAEAAGLRAIVDLHILRSHYFNDADEPALYRDPAARAHFVALWEQLSERLGGRPTDLVAYELLNEPVARVPERWNDAFTPVFAALRAREPERTIVLGSNDFQQPKTFPALAIPDDPRAVLSFHFYYPMFITHYKASWWRNGGWYTGTIQYPGTPVTVEGLAALDDEQRAQALRQGAAEPFGRETMVSLLAPVLAARERTGLPLYCGEFGVIKNAPQAIRLAWYRDLISVFDEHGIAWANWDYRGGFGLVDGDGRDTGIAAALLG